MVLACRNSRKTSGQTSALVVGCGGLGCELVKILSQTGGFQLTLVDFDTIDLTNLNRQFYYTRDDIGKSKSQRLASKVNCAYFCSKIEEVDSIEFYRGFGVVFNCLDSDRVRSHVNKMCYLSRTRLIDGASGGWLG
ncbi:SAE2 [Enterospora canceri]|uniref:SAE2 n=1 Tax=Enterospora canceri TaxID=1081671 RepID=A0A1Y1S5K0_9MICR|nr:SAE2 [Enterospora canceri]